MSERARQWSDGGGGERGRERESDKVEPVDVVGPNLELTSWLFLLLAAVRLRDPRSICAPDKARRQAHLLPSPSSLSLLMSCKNRSCLQGALVPVA